MELLIARHGNTFAPAEKVVWVGRREDLPLSEGGVLQARRLAGALAAAGTQPVCIYCAPLKRTRQFAEVLAAELQTAEAPRADERLSEIDYGAWGGFSSEEIAERFGREALEAWSRESRWPPPGQWRSSEHEIHDAIRGFADDIVHRHAGAEQVLVVSSNGCMRFFLSLIPGELEARRAAGTLKVKTGHLCKLTWDAGVFRLGYWNCGPEELTGAGS